MAGNVESNILFSSAIELHECKPNSSLNSVSLLVFKLSGSTSTSALMSCKHSLQFLDSFTALVSMTLYCKLQT